MRAAARTCGPLLALAAAVSAQAVHLVGPGGFAQIQQAINAATDGDVVVVQSGSYEPFTLTKSLLVTAGNGATVDIAPVLFGNGGPSVLQPATHAAVVGLRFRNGPFPLTTNHTEVRGGTVYFADCAFESGYGYPPPAALLVQDAAAALQRCLVYGGGLQSALGGTGPGNDGLAIVRATVSAVDSAFYGGNLNWDFSGHGGHGVAVDDGTVQFANCLAVGGGNDPLITYAQTGDGMHVTTTSRVTLADCALVGGNGHTVLGGVGLDNEGALAVRQARSTFLGGQGVPTGTAVIGLLATAPLPGFAGAVPPFVLGTTWNATLRATPTTPVLLVFGDIPAPVTTPLLTAPLWPTGNLGVDVGVTDAVGALARSVAVPASPALLHAELYVQVLAGSVLPLEATPVIGGPIR